MTSPSERAHDVRWLDRTAFMRTSHSAAYSDMLAGKPVLDTINYIKQRDGRIPELYDGSLSSSEVLQRHLGTAYVVKVFNNITGRGGPRVRLLFQNQERMKCRLP